jgi:hypothetical protein
MRIEDEGGASLRMVRFHLWRGEAAALVHDAREAVETLLGEVADEALRPENAYTVTLEIHTDGSLSAFANQNAKPT